jgi:ABC-type multidrug transport system ATPase subunit
MTAAPLVISDLTVTYCGEKLLDGINLTVRPSSVTALLGRNISAKRLLMRLAARGYKDKTRFFEDERVLAERPVSGDVTYVLEGKPLFSFFSAHEYLNYRLSYFPSKERGQIIKDRLELFGLPDTRRRLKRFAPWELKLLEIAGCLAPRPILIINACDLEYCQKCAEALNRALDKLKGLGHSILISFSDTRYVTECVDLAAVISDGGRLIESTPAEIIAQSVPRIVLRPKGNIKLFARKLREIAAAHAVRVSGDKVIVRASNLDEAGRKIIEALAANGGSLEELKVLRPTLSAAVREVTK